MCVKETKQRSGWKSVSERFMGGQTGGASTEAKRPDVFASPYTARICADTNWLLDFSMSSNHVRHGGRRYPYDPYDRTWQNNIPGVNPNSTQLAINTTSSVVVDFNHWNKVPEIVMQTADSWPKGESVTITTSFLPDYNKNYYIAFDFAEISPQAESQSRIFSLALNGKTVWNSINVALDRGMYMADEYYFDDIMLNSTGSFELSADPTSQLGPILNALELFVLTDPAPNRTFPTDGKPSPPLCTLQIVRRD
jgi:hypothetical protein